MKAQYHCGPNIFFGARMCGAILANRTLPPGLSSSSFAIVIRWVLFSPLVVMDRMRGVRLVASSWAPRALGCRLSSRFTSLGNDLRWYAEIVVRARVRIDAILNLPKRSLRGLSALFSFSIWVFPLLFVSFSLIFMDRHAAD